MVSSSPNLEFGYKVSKLTHANRFKVIHNIIFRIREAMQQRVDLKGARRNQMTISCLMLLNSYPTTQLR